MTLQAIRYGAGRLAVLDQLLLPHETTFIDVQGTADGWAAINRMQVRGAPAIAVVGALSLAVELHRKCFDDVTSLVEYVNGRLDYLVTARPTAVNMADTARKMAAMTRMLAEDEKLTVKEAQNRIIADLEGMLQDDIATNKKMADHGARHVLRHHGNEQVTMLTHCNTGALATAGYGTALGVVRSLHAEGRLEHCYCTETRPYNQGSRLTAYELVTEQIPATLICDSMAAMLMATHDVSAVVVGADRVVANGDTANKVGTYQLAIVAKHHGVPFYVVAPSTSVDLSLETGSQITIEQRPPHEMTSIKGIEIAAPGIGVWNPAFDVTPADLITGGIVTEFGVFPPGALRQELAARMCPVAKATHAGCHFAS